MNQDSRVSEEFELSIVMPCLNEAETLEKCIVKAMRFLAENNVIGEVIIGDNGSTDGSQEIARRCGARVVSVAMRGYGAALYRATQSARGRFIIMGDSDDSYDFTALMPFVRQLREGFDLVMGNRFSGGIRPGAMPWKNRYIGNPILSTIGRVFFSCPVRDFHCGLRGFSKQAFERMDLRTAGMEFASEMVIKAKLLKMRIAEVPTTLDPDGRSRPPHLRPWRDGWRHLRFMLLYSPRWLFLLPGAILMFIGVIGMAALDNGPIMIGKVMLDVHTLIYAAMTALMGYQAVNFSLFTRIFAISEGLLPEDPGLKVAFRYVTLELGLLAGGVLILLGLIGSVFAVWVWSSRSFGPLDPRVTLRLVVPSAFALMLGFQTALNSFFFSVLGLRIRRLDAPAEELESGGPPSTTKSNPSNMPTNKEPRPSFGRSGFSLNAGSDLLSR